MSKKDLEKMCKLLDDQSASCKKTAIDPNVPVEYANSFHVCHIVLMVLSDKLRKVFNEHDDL